MRSFTFPVSLLSFLPCSSVATSLGLALYLLPTWVLLVCQEFLAVRIFVDMCFCSPCWYLMRKWWVKWAQSKTELNKEEEEKVLVVEEEEEEEEETQ